MRPITTAMLPIARSALVWLPEAYQGRYWITTATASWRNAIGSRGDELAVRQLAGDFARYHYVPLDAQISEDDAVALDNTAQVGHT